MTTACDRAETTIHTGPFGTWPRGILKAPTVTPGDFNYEPRPAGEVVPMRTSASPPPGDNAPESTVQSTAPRESIQAAGNGGADVFTVRRSVKFHLTDEQIGERDTLSRYRKRERIGWTGWFTHWKRLLASAADADDAFLDAQLAALSLGPRLGLGNGGGGPCAVAGFSPTPLSRGLRPPRPWKTPLGRVRAAGDAAGGGPGVGGGGRLPGAARGGRAVRVRGGGGDGGGAARGLLPGPARLLPQAGAPRGPAARRDRDRDPGRLTAGPPRH